MWWDEDEEEWRTDFPPRAGFDGEEWGAFGDDGYQRTLDEGEEAVSVAERALDEADWLAEATDARDAWLEAARVELAAALAARGLPADWGAGARDEPTFVTPAVEPGSRFLSPHPADQRDPG